MYCGWCGKKIPEGKAECPECGWKKTVAKDVSFNVIQKRVSVREEGKPERPEALAQQPPPPAPAPEVSPPPPPASAAAASSPPVTPKPAKAGPRRRGDAMGVFKPIFGCFTVGVFVIALFVTGAVLLFNHRGFAWQVWKSSETNPEVEKHADATTPSGKMMQTRDELLSISSQISGIEQGLPYSPVKIKKRLQEINVEIDACKNDPQYFRVYALLKSVEFQFDLTEKREIQADIPPLPFSTFAPQPTDEYVMKDLSSGDLLKGKILKGCSTSGLRYGPGLFSFLNDLRVFDKLHLIEAPEHYKFVEVLIGIEGNADLVEYSVRMLDDYRRAFPPYLEGEKEARKKKLPVGHSLWRDTPTTQKGKTLILHRIFLLPEHAISRPILEIKRQGSSKVVWVQY
jgi:hypothetical protein